MSGDGGDMGGGGDAGSGGKGSGSDSGSGFGSDVADYTSSSPAYSSSSPGYGSGASSDVADYSSGPSTSPASSFTGTTSNGSSVDDFVNNPTGNLTGPGPVSGDTGLPNGGGGSNQPFSWDTFTAPNLDGVNASDFTGPVASNGVFDSGTTPVTSSSPFDNLISGGGPASASAASSAAPSSVSGNTDISSSGTNLTSAKPTNSSSGSGSGSDILSSLGVGKGNNLGAAVSAIGLANNLINGQGALPQSANLTANANSATALANQQTASGQALQQWQTTGTLPAAYTQQVEKAAQDAKTKAISNAAAQGLPTDPTLNTALAQQLNAIDAAVPQQKEAIAAQLAQTGQAMINSALQATGVSSSVYQTLANLETAKNQAQGQAISNFASALNGGGNKGLTLKVA